MKEPEVIDAEYELVRPRRLIQWARLAEWTFIVGSFMGAAWNAPDVAPMMVLGCALYYPFKRAFAALSETAPEEEVEWLRRRYGPLGWRGATGRSPSGSEVVSSHSGR